MAASRLLLAAGAAALALAACSPQKPATPPAQFPATVPEAPAPAPTPVPAQDPNAPVEAPVPGSPAGLPDDRTPISEAPFTPQSAQGAADVVQTYYALHCQTRRRHGVPPQPFRFFASIHRHLLARGLGWVIQARWRERIVASAIFLQFGRRANYKYGASDKDFQSLRPSTLLMWEAIKWHAAHGFDSLHFGRTSLANEGLRRFKLGFGPREVRLENFRYDFRRQEFVTTPDYAHSPLNSVFRRLPLPRACR